MKAVVIMKYTLHIRVRVNPWERPDQRQRIVP